MNETEFRPFLFFGLMAVSVLLLILGVAVILYCWFTGNFVILITIPIIALFLYWLFIESKTRAIRVSVGEDRFVVKSHWGYGSEKTIYFSFITGYKTEFLPGEYKDFEYLHLVSGDKKVIQLFEFYHRNYFELKTLIEERFLHMGHEKFNFFRAVKESLGL